MRNIATKCMLVLGSLLTGLIVCYSRVYLGYHTIEQVVVGALVGSLIALVWFYMIHTKISPRYFGLIVSWYMLDKIFNRFLSFNLFIFFSAILPRRISELLMLRDYTNIPDIISFQYKSERNEANRYSCKI